MPRRVDLYGKRRRYSWRSSWPLLGGLALWVALAFLAPGLDDGPRGDWDGRGHRGRFERPYCPACALVEEHVTDNVYVSGAVGVLQLIVFATPFAIAGALLPRAGSSQGVRERQRDIEAERIERSLRRSGHLRGDGLRDDDRYDSD